MSDKLRWLFNKIYKLLTNSTLSLHHWLKREAYPHGNKIFQICWLSATFQSLAVWGVFGLGSAFFLTVFMLLTKPCIIDFTVVCREISIFHFLSFLSSLKFSSILVLQIAMSMVYNEFKKKNLHISWTWCNTHVHFVYCFH